MAKRRVNIEYVAEDGQVFDNKEACTQHERHERIRKIAALYDIDESAAKLEDFAEAYYKEFKSRKKK